MSTKKPTGNGRSSTSHSEQDNFLLPNEEHPDYQNGTFGEDVDALESVDYMETDGLKTSPLPGIPPKLPLPVEGIPNPFPGPIIPPLKFCVPVSGYYTLKSALALPRQPITTEGVESVLPLNLISLGVRVDVDRFTPQDRISIEISRRFPRQTGHVIAEVTSDQCLGLNNRRVTATITYRDGNTSLIPGDKVVFEAKRGRSLAYETYKITFSGAGIKKKTYNLVFKSKYFDSVEFEVDRVSNANVPTTTYDTGSHPNRPGNLPVETISMASVFQRAGFNATMSPNSSVIPIADAGGNGTWSDAEMHNAMVTYWSRFADRPQWAMWVLFAARHDMGRGLGGIMFDDIGPNHRQGTAIFTDSFIQDVPTGDAAPAAWRNRMVFWTAIHEIGHGFNLAHSWQKSLGTPWIPLANEPEARSFMNYPMAVRGGQSSFFSDFRFRFSNDELVFLRHAPRRFVQMGNSDWFVNHGFEAPDLLSQQGNWALEVRPNREINTYSFLEPVVMEMKLTNNSGDTALIDKDMLEDGRHITVFVQREGGLTKQWRPMITRCHETHNDKLKTKESIYGAHTISASTDGWIIDEPGFYKVQAAVDVDGEIVVSNVLRLWVTFPLSAEESLIAADYFTEDVGRVLTFGGAPQLTKANETLQNLVERCPNNPAALHAGVAVSTPMLRDFKWLDAGKGNASLEVRSTKADVDGAAKIQMAALLKSPEKAANTFGHIPYFGALNGLANAMSDASDTKGAKQVLQNAVSTMKKRDVLQSVIQAEERKLSQLK